MQFERAITPTVVIADQPTDADLSALKANGYVAVVNLRNDGEPEQPIGVAAEGDMLRASGIDYIHMGVGSTPLSADGVESVCKFIDDHADGKVLVHCRKGGRAAAIVLIHQAVANGWAPAEAAEKGKAIGLEVGGGLRTLVEDYLEGRRDGGGSGR